MESSFYCEARAGGKLHHDTRVNRKGGALAHGQRPVNNVTRGIDLTTRTQHLKVQVRTPCIPYNPGSVNPIWYKGITV